MPRNGAVALLVCGIAGWLSSSAVAEPLENPAVGPMTICFKYSTFRLDAAETVTDMSGSPENVQVDIVGPSGKFSIGESEIFKADVWRGALVRKAGQTRVYSARNSRTRYDIYGPTSFSDGSDRLVVRLTGNAFRGTAADAEIYKRVEIHDPLQAHCKRIFTYGWDL